jgi:hypothetical protein
MSAKLATIARAEGLAARQGEHALRHVGGEEPAVLVGLDEGIRPAGSVGQGVCRQIDGRREVAAGEPLETIRCSFPYRGHRGGRVDKALDLGIITGLSDDGPAVGVGNEDHGALDPVQHATQVGSVDRQAPQGIGEAGDRIALALEPRNHRMPD